MTIQQFTFNPFQENTYLLFDETKEAIVIDPGCMNATEESILFTFIEQQNLVVKAIVNTHNHIDHVFGVTAVREKYNVPFYCHEGEIQGLLSVPTYAPMYGIHVAPIAEPEHLITTENPIEFGTTQLEVRFTPGHSPASVCFVHHESKRVIAGDVLFDGSIGRTDLPGGDYSTLMESIEKELLTLPDEYEVYPGHGPVTTIGKERSSNPFILEYQNNK